MRKYTIPLWAIMMGLLAATSCKSTQETTKPADGQHAETDVSGQAGPALLASIQRTACYGQCPIYKATFMDNGEVIYVGKRFVEKTGTYRTLISSEEVSDIKEKVLAFNYFELDSLYPTLATDFPSCITEVNLDGRSKRVINRRNPPPDLRAFEKFLDGFLEGRELEKVSDETSYEGLSH